MLQETWTDTDSDSGVGMIAEVNEQTTDEVWTWYDTGSAVTVRPDGCQEELGTRSDDGGPRCEAATGNAVTL